MPTYEATVDDTRSVAPPVSVREMDDGISDHLSEKHRPKTSRAASKARPAAE